MSVREHELRLEDPQFYLDDPYTTYQWLHKERPVYRYEPLDVLVLSKYEDIRSVLMQPELFSLAHGAVLGELRVRNESGTAIFQKFIDPAGELFSFTDPPRHGQLRRVIAPAFSARAARDAIPRIRAHVAALVDHLEVGTPADFVAQVSARLPILVSTQLLGVPTADFDRVRVWTEMIERIGAGTSSVDELLKTAESFGALQDYLRTQFAIKSRNPGDDLISTLLTAQLDGSPLSEARMLAYCTAVVAGGAHSTRALLSGMALALARHPEQRALLARDRRYMVSAVEEGLRWTTPTRGFLRTALHDTEIRGHPVRAGQRVYLLYSAGNMDDEVFANPTGFDITRTQPPQHLAFGWGVHICIAAQLVRVQAVELFAALLDRFPDFETAGEPMPVVSVLRNGWVNMPLIFGP